VQEIVGRIADKMKHWGITVTFLSSQLNVSRQYAWQIKHYRTSLSRERALEIEQTVDAIIRQGRHVKTFGDRLRAARIAAGMTLKQAAGAIGYTWVGIERWEKNLCMPKPMALSRLLELYGGREPRSHRSHPLQVRFALPSPVQSRSEQSLGS
jgi:DNA-binding XRE family transcriptional regulator